MKILILPRYENLAASSRYRFYQYIPYLKKIGWDVTVKPLLSNNYVKHLYYQQPLKLDEIIKGYLNRIYYLLRRNKYNIIWLQQEILPWLPNFIESSFINSDVKLVSDYDDAFFHRYDLHQSKIIRMLFKNKIDSVMSSSDLILAGNDYLAKRALLNNPAEKIEIFPTVVDTDKYSLNNYTKKNNEFTIGWIGSPGTEKYLTIVSKVLKEVYKLGNIKISLIGAKNFSIDGVNLNLIKWNEETEIQEIFKFDVGIMPLIDSPWEKGKCGFKLIQYMACGVPVIGSPVGVNTKIISHGENGFLAKNDDEWTKSLKFFIENSEQKKIMGSVGKRLVEKEYSLKNNIIRLKELFENLISE